MLGARSFPVRSEPVEPLYCVFAQILGGYRQGMGKAGAAHQVRVYSPGRFPDFGNGPNHQGCAAHDVASGEHADEVGRHGGLADF